MRPAKLRKRWILFGGFAVAATAFGVGYVRTTDWFRPTLHERPPVIAHRGGSGQWPQNSRTAVLAAIGAGYGGIEIDLALTKDGVPVLSHDPWVHERLCRRADGSAPAPRTLVKDYDLAALQRDFTCGDVHDPDFPAVVPVRESIMTLDGVLTALRSAPEVHLYLDVKIDGELTATPREYARAIFERWDAADLPNPLWVEGPDGVSLRAFRNATERPFVAVLSFPPFTAEEPAAETVVRARWQHKLGLYDPLEAARAAGADAIVSHTAVISWAAAQRVLEAGLLVALFTPNTRADLDRYCGWPASLLITDFPELGGCE